MTEPTFIPFDASTVRAWPEFQTLAHALEDFAQRANKTLPAATQIDFEQTLVALARNLVASDCCDLCPVACAPVAPYALERDGSWGNRARYRCPNGHEWATWWSSRGMVVELG